MSNVYEGFSEEVDLSTLVKSYKRTNRVSIEQPLAETEEEIRKEERDFTHWVKVGANRYYPGANQIKVDIAPPGVYSIGYDTNRNSFFLNAKEVSTDELFNLPCKEQNLILKDIEDFWKSKERFEKYKFNYKRGILLYGPAGNGKTSIINLLVNDIVKNYGGVVFSLTTLNDLENFMIFITQNFRVIEKDKPILCILEDLETFTQYREGESTLLNILDGVNQLSSIVFLGTTNYPEQLKERILNRPSRFDRRYKLSYPPAEVRKYYFEKKLSPDDLATINLSEWVEKSEGFSISHLGEIVKSVFALGNTFDHTMEMLKSMNQKISSDDFAKDKGLQKTIGFK